MAFEHIYDRYWSALYAYVFNRLRDKNTCQEIVQDVFLNLWSKRDDAIKITSLSGYLFVGVKYRMLNVIKSDHVRKAFADDYSAFVASDQNHNTEEWIQERDLQSALQSNVDRLAPRCKQIFELSRIHHYSIQDISSSLNLSTKTVENQLTKALKLLRLGLGEFLSLCLVVIFY